MLGIVSIFTYGMKAGLDRLATAGVRNISLCDFDTIVRVAAQQGFIRGADTARLIAFRDDPADQSWIHQSI